MKKIKVIYRKLGRQKVYGFAHCGFNQIEIDSRVKSKKHLELIIHESMHILFPEAEEEEVESKAIILCNTIWGEHYRRVDKSRSLPLQDGSK